MNGMPQELQHRLDRPVLALAPVQRDRDDVRRVAAQSLDERAVDVPLADVDAGIAQGEREPPPGPQRHLAFVGQAAGQDGHSSFAHKRILRHDDHRGSGPSGSDVPTARDGSRRSTRAMFHVKRREPIGQGVWGPGVCGPLRDAPSGERAGLPNVRMTSSSASSTPASLRTPSVIRSGVG